MKIANKSELFKAAWKMFKANKITFSEALKIAWAMFKEYLTSKKELTTKQKELYKAMVWANKKVSAHASIVDFKDFEASYNAHKTEFASIWKFAAKYARQADKMYCSHL